jgi:hypothetical protein
VTGADYVKKIFQVPFGLPRVNPDDPRAFFDALIGGADLPEEQAADLWATVWPHLEFISEDGSVNPREVKRLVNAYTLQMKLLSGKLRPQQPDPNVVLALQVMVFRSEWRRLYELLAADSTLFLEALRTAIDDRSGLQHKASRSPLAYEIGAQATRLRNDVKAGAGRRGTGPAVARAGREGRGLDRREPLRAAPRSLRGQLLGLAVGLTWAVASRCISRGPWPSANTALLRRPVAASPSSGWKASSSASATTSS